MRPPEEAELLAARLARMKALTESLEAETSRSAQERDTFAKQKRELDAAGLSSTLVKP